MVVPSEKPPEIKTPCPKKNKGFLLVWRDRFL
jgi:hypothetical protein